MDNASRAAYRGQVTRVVNSANDYLRSPESNPTSTNEENWDSIEEELLVFLNRLQVAHEGLIKANNEFVATADTAIKDMELTVEYEDKATSIITRLNQRLQRLNRLRNPNGSISPNVTTGTNASLSRERNNGVRLPKLPLKTFSGDFKEWLPFWEQFKTAVHNNESLSGADKFNYLQSTLTGKATDLIAGFTPSGNCYDSALALLQEEFGNAEKLIDKNMNELMSISLLSSKDDIRGLRNIYNTVTSSIRSLIALSIPPSNYAIMLKSKLLNCLPKELRANYFRFQGQVSNEETRDSAADIGNNVSSESECSFNLDGDKQLTGLLKFIKREIVALENSVGEKLANNQMRQTKQFSTAAGLLTASKSQPVCFFCKSAAHDSKDCNNQLTVTQRKNLLKQDNRCFRCTSKGHSSKRCYIRNLKCSACGGRHANSMCDPDYRQKQLTKVNGSSNSIKAVNLYATMKRENPSNVFLQTASVFALNMTKELSVYGRLVIDGGSQMTFIKESLAERLCLPVVGSRNVCVIPFGTDKKQKTPEKNYKIVELYLKSQYGENMLIINAIVVPTICLDVLSIPTEKCVEKFNLVLADGRPYDCQPEEGISVLIGADNYWRVVLENTIRINEGLMAIETLFGWTLQGPAHSKHFPSSLLSYANTLIVSAFDEKTFWDLESIGIKPIQNECNSFTEDYIDKCIIKNSTRYEASLPWKNDGRVLESNRANAFSRFQSLVKRLSRTPADLLRYDNAIRELIVSGVAEMVEDESDPENIRTYYMPHRGVYREDKETSKLRIVFDASAHAEDYASLNECLKSGSNLLPDLLMILLNFRTGLIALVADIEKAFLQITLNRGDRECHRFFCFKSGISDVCDLPKAAIFRMNRITFGVTSSPFILAATLRKHLQSERSKFPEVCQVLEKSYYVDDFVMSVNDENFANKVYCQSKSIFDGASMKLRKWNSNHQCLRDSFSEVPPDRQKVLGIYWYIHTDELCVDIEPVLNSSELLKTKPTKRSILQIISRFYDPLGILSPFLINFKILFQMIWKQKLAWDEELPGDILKTFYSLYEGVGVLKEISIPRCVFDGGDFEKSELHLFADASKSGYGAVAYVRTINSKNKTTVRFLCAKNRVSPLKDLEKSSQLTLPKLELTAALVAARLCSYVLKNLKVPFSRICLWTDSKITLCWITNTSKKKWKPYVENRVDEIQKLTSGFDWYHCPGKDNPADLLTRGVTSSLLATSEQWIHGPPWLSCDFKTWPVQTCHNDITNTLLSLHVTNDDPAKNDAFGVETLEPLLPAEDYSSWKRLLRVTSFVIRAIPLLRERFFGFKSRRTTIAEFQVAEYRSRSRVITVDELKTAEDYWIKYTQRNEYSEEMEVIKKGNKVNKSSNLYIFNPIIENGILRVHSRLRDCNEEGITAFPIILPKRSYVTKLIVLHVHNQMLHSGTGTTLAELRKRFWMIRGRQLVKSIISKCEVCIKLLASPGSEPIAPLPRDRMLTSRPFEMTGIDYAGPLYIKDPAANGSSMKAYILLLTCGTIRAVHLELVTDLTTECCLLALRRFFARRGKPKIIYSDNAKTFKCASKELKVLNDIVGSELVQGFVNSEGIRWKFIVERAAWWGGFWERLVRSVKFVLKLTIGRAVLNFEELRTLLIEVERVINSRPLTYISDDPKDISPLTPLHFLTGFHFSLDLSQFEEQETSQSLRVKWDSRLKTLKSFWKRWRLEYLQQLRSLHQFKTGGSTKIKINDVVIIHDPSVSKMFWKLAVVEEVFPGRDGKVRACQIRLANGTRLRRPVQLLYSLEIV